MKNLNEMKTLANTILTAVTVDRGLIQFEGEGIPIVQLVNSAILLAQFVNELPDVDPSRDGTADNS